ncbi:hypothetical protein [Microbacterium sp. G2-8]|uniref:hypothetical protein n=1 Tax=Microbacterium sp. G2-8 TaxID=2842454 RepID=UPI0021AA6C12|nr:hypothetical protein [Microbacterium sp. G2-8]
MRSMKILVVCGAGASSTFVAARLERAARASGLALAASAQPLASFADTIRGADAVLLGSHLPDGADTVRAVAGGHGVPVAVLPSDIARDRDGSRALALVQDML